MHHKIINGFTGYNGNRIGFNGNCNVGLYCQLFYWWLVKTNNGICPKTHYRKPFLMVKTWFVMIFVMVLEFSLMFQFFFYLLPHCFYIIFCNYEFIRVKTIAFV